MASPATPPEFYERLERLARSSGLTLNAFGQSAGFAPGTFARILRDQVSIGVNHIIHMLISYPDVNPRWLLLGEPPMLIPEAERENKSAMEADLLKLRGENEALREVLEVWADRMVFGGDQKPPKEDST